MGAHLQGQWAFVTGNAAITSSIQFPTNSYANTIISLKLNATAATYVDFYGRTANSTSSFLIPANAIVDFDPFLGDKISFHSSTGAGFIYCAYYQNIYNDLSKY